MKTCARMRTALALALAPGLLFLSSLSLAAHEGAQAGQPPQGSTAPGGSESQVPATTPTPGPQQGTAAPNNPKKPANQTPQASSHRKRRVHAQQQTSGKVVVRNGGARERDTELTPGMSEEQARRQRQNTTQLMARTDSNLKQVAGRELTPAEQGMIGQIRTYLRQAKAAEESGDVSRAHTLAYKAQLLSSELAHRR